MSKRLKHYESCRKGSPSETLGAILQQHSNNKRAGRRQIETYETYGESGKSVRRVVQTVPSSLPMNPDKAARLAARLHQK